MGKVQVLRLSNRHEAILEHIVANPTQKMGEVALEFGVSPAWLSTLVHSDAFQEALRKKRGEVFHPAMMDVRQRLTGMAHLVMDKIEENLENDKFAPGQLLEIQDDVLDRLGYGTGNSGAATPGVTINNYGSAPAGTVAEARARWANAQRVDEEPEDADINAIEDNRDGAENEIYSVAEEREPTGGNSD